MTRQQVNALAMKLNFPFDHSKHEVKDLDKLVQLVNLALDQVIYTRLSEPLSEINERKKQDVIVVSEKVWRPIFEQCANEVRELNT